MLLSTWRKRCPSNGIDPVMFHVEGEVHRVIFKNNKQFIRRANTISWAFGVCSLIFYFKEP